MAILYHLEDDYRVPLRELAAAVGMARPTVRRRITALFKANRFAGYQVEVDRLALGLERLVYLEVKTNPREAWLLRAIESLDQCIQSDGVIGEYGLIFKMAFRDGRELANRVQALDSLIASSDSKRYRIIDVIEPYKERGLTGLAQKREHLDEVDRTLLRVLMIQDSPSPLPLWRLSLALENEMDRRISRSTIQKRMRRMEEQGIIRRFTIRPRRWTRDPGVRAYVRLKTDPGQTRNLANNILSKMPEVLCLYRTGEDYSLFSEVFVHDLKSLDDFLKRIYVVEGIIDTLTTIVVEKRKEVQIPRSVLI